MMHLLHTAVFAEARLNCSLFSTYIDTRANHLADSLSHDHATHFHSPVPAADLLPTLVSPQLLELLLNLEADWSSPTWCRHFDAIFKQA